MTDLREILAADALTPSEVGAFADPASRWVTVDTALLLIERLHPVPRPASRPVLAQTPVGQREALEVETPTEAPEPPRGVTAAGRPTSGVLPPDPVRQPLLASGSGTTPRPAAPA